MIEVIFTIIALLFAVGEMYKWAEQVARHFRQSGKVPLSFLLLSSDLIMPRPASLFILSYTFG